MEVRYTHQIVLSDADVTYTSFFMSGVGITRSQANSYGLFYNTEQ